MNDELTCVCGHYKSDHTSYNESVAGPYCIIRKCMCHMYHARPDPLAMDGKSVCLRAIWYLEKDGWCQGSFLNEGGNRDITSAIKMAANWQRAPEKEVLDRIFNIVPEMLMKWNDKSGRTVQDCIDLLTLAAESFTDDDDQTGDDDPASSNASDPELNIEGCS